MIQEADYRKYNQVKFYFGIVNEVLDDYSIRFRIPNIIDNLNDDEYPIAHPILKHTSEIFKSDTVLIMQLDIDMQDFVYFSNDVTGFTGLRFGSDIIDLSLGKEENPSLTIKVAKLEKGDKDEGEEYEVKGSYSEIVLSDGGLDINVNKDGDDNQNKANININRDGKITITSKEDTVATLNGKDSKLELKSGDNNTITIDKNSSKIELKTGSSSQTIDGNNNVKSYSAMMSGLDLGTLVELKNAAGGLKGSLDDIWTELSTLCQNTLTLANLCAAIQFVGPGALTNTTSGAIAGLTSSIATIQARKALVSSVFK